jgi:hypothetical protein
VARKLTTIMHCMWVDGSSIRFSDGQAASGGWPLSALAAA